MRTFTYERAASLPAALQAPAGAFLAGGTTLLDLVKLDVMRPEHVVDISRLPLDRIERTSAGGLRIGANVRNSTLAWDANVRRNYPLVAEAVLSGATGQIRNMATTAGNLRQRVRCPYFRDGVSACNKRDPGSGCAARDGYNRMHAVLGGSAACVATHPSDLCVALAALEASVVIASRSGERIVRLEGFHLLPQDTPEREHAIEPHEIITGVLLPSPVAGAGSKYLKIRDRASFEFALTSAAVVVRVARNRIDHVRIALGGVGTVPWRSREAEAVLEGELVDDTVLHAAAEAALRDAVPLRHNAFKIPLARHTLRQALRDAIEQARSS